MRHQVLLLALAMVVGFVAVAPEASAATCMGAEGPGCCAAHEYPGPHYDNCMACVAGAVTWWDTETNQCYI